MKNKLEKTCIVPKKCRSLKNSHSIERIIGYVISKSNIRQKMRVLNSLIVPKNVKGGPFEIFQHPFCCKISKKRNGDIKTLPQTKTKMRILNSLIVPKNMKAGTLWNFFSSILLQNIKK